MTQPALASAVVLPDIEDRPKSANGSKRRPSLQLEPEQKRQRLSPGKKSPDVAESGTRELREDRRKSGATDEKKRSKRLFGALLGTLSQSSSNDRASKRRADIENRKKAELQKQEDERNEERKRRLERLAELRNTEQRKVDEQNMRIRHSSMLNMANFLQTSTEPKLYYKPWELRPDEEDRIKQQLEEAQDTIDQELYDFEEKRREQQRIGPSNGSNGNAADSAAQSASAAAESKRPDEADTTVKSTPPATVLVSDRANASQEQHTNPVPNSVHELDAKIEGRDQTEDSGDVVEGEEDTVIY